MFFWKGKTLKNWRYFTTENREPFKVCIVGAGPAGLYTAGHLLKKIPSNELKIDILERFPCPFGLVRFGVAPDHPEVKNVMHKFNTILDDPRVHFYGGIQCSTVSNSHSISFSNLKNFYHAIVLAYGASHGKHLNIPGEKEASNVFLANDFVGWYNGLFGCENLNPNLEHETAVIIGHGNVALDMARILLSPLDLLEKTDISEHALNALRKSKVKNIHIIGRRGPCQVSFTTKEVRELLQLPRTRLLMNSELVRQELQKQKTLDRSKKRLMDCLLQGATHQDGDKSWQLHFYQSPKEILLDSSNRITHILLQENKLNGTQLISTEKQIAIPCGMLLKSIGSSCVTMDHLPWNGQHILNVNGKVNDHGIYVAGWLKTGPTGTIATTLFNAVETANSILNDKDQLWQKKCLPSSQLYHDKNFVSFKEWKFIDELEIKLGKEKGKPREKIVNEQEMRRIAHQKS